MAKKASRRRTLFTHVSSTAKPNSVKFADIVICSFAVIFFACVIALASSWNSQKNSSSLSVVGPL